MVKNIVLGTVWRMTQRYPVISPDDYTAQYEATQHLLAAGYRQPLCSGYRKVRWQQGIVGRGFEQASA